MRGLRQPGLRPQAEKQPGPGASAAGEEIRQAEPWIHCRECLHPVTRDQERISVAGAHRHTFANPHGIVFEIACFKQAPGCAHAGPASAEFSWFAGCTWRVALCGACLGHLGWVFHASAGGSFYGLILDRLIEPS
ncbi:MAG: cereblon family protein [Desulfobacterales bacterium]